MDFTAIVDKARTSWLKNNEVLELLEGYATAGLTVCTEPPVKPAGGQLFLYDRRSCRFFRRDGHTWRKKPDGKTIRETHEKLKVGNSETLNCYYAHADQEDGLQRRCYWQLDPEKEHIVLVHYLCCASSRAGTQRAASLEYACDAAAVGAPGALRPQRSTRQQQRRSYSPPPAVNGMGRRRGSSQTRLSPVATSSSLESDILSQSSILPDTLQLPLVQGLTHDAAAPLPPFGQQYALQPQVTQPVAAAHHVAAVAQQAAVQPGLPVSHPQLQLHHFLQTRGSTGSATGSGEIDPFGLPTVTEHQHQRPHPGVLYTDQRVATQLAAQQASVQPSLLPPRSLVKQESFTVEHKSLFREMSLGIQRETPEEGAFDLVAPPIIEQDPLAADKVAAGTPGADLAALLASPPHGGHRRSFSRQGSGLSRLISKNWESEVMEMLPDVDADISAYPVGNGVVVEVAERPSSPSSRLFHQAGIAFFGSANNDRNVNTAVQHALEPSPLGGPSLPLDQPDVAAVLAPGGSGGPARLLPFASPLQLGPSPGSPLAGAGAGSVQFAAGDANAIAQRSRDKLPRVSGAGMARSGSHSHLASLSRRSINAGSEVVGEEEQQQRRKERVDAAAIAAASAAQEHRDEKLAAVRNRRAATSTDPEETLEMIDVPENMQRLSSFMHRGLNASASRLTLGRELAAAEAASMADLELETRSLLKHMSIDELDAVAAVRDAAKELEVMPTIPAAPSSDLEAASAAPSLSDELASRNQSVNSLLDGVQASVAAQALSSQSLDPIGAQLQAAVAQHAARQAR